jgi:hypothetical protein
MEWAASYETAGPKQRSLAAHETWLRRQSAPVPRLDASPPVRDLVEVASTELRRA